MGTRTVLALDDDPTGTQTVRDVPVLTRWDGSLLPEALQEQLPVVYVLTNSRSLPPERARDLGRDLGRLLRAAAVAVGRDWSVVSRSDSTLRGHFPIEVDALADGLGVRDARIVLAPYLGEAGRVTIGGVHYLRHDKELVPVGRTEFARDPVFGYRSSDLREWVTERVAAVQAPPRATAVVTLHELRAVGPDSVRDALLALPPGGVLVADSVEDRDIEVVALGAAWAEEAGLPLIARTAGSFVRARAGQAPAVLIDPASIATGRPGIVVVGSHVPTTTGQLQRLLAEPPISTLPIEVDVASLVRDPSSREQVATRVTQAAENALGAGLTPVIYTSRMLIRGQDEADDLDVASLVSSTLVRAVAMLDRRPAWVLAKGGITSSDIATVALGVVRAHVVGPLMPGVSLWQLGNEARWPGIPYVVFPGNVGRPDSVRQAVALLAGADQ